MNGTPNETPPPFLQLIDLKYNYSKYVIMDESSERESTYKLWASELDLNMNQTY